MPENSKSARSSFFIGRSKRVFVLFQHKASSFFTVAAGPHGHLLDQRFSFSFGKENNILVTHKKWAR